MVHEDVQDGSGRIRRTVVGFGGAIGDCGALRLTEMDADEDGSGDPDTNTDTAEADADASKADAANSETAGLRQSSSPKASSPAAFETASSSLFDADFDVKLNTETGRWMISNVNVFKRS